MLDPKRTPGDASATSGNPLLREASPMLGLPPFALIRAEHFEPAFEHAMRLHLDEVDRIASQPEAPTFDNTVVAFDRAGVLMAQVEAAFRNLAASMSEPALQAVERTMAPRIAAHAHAVHAHRGFFLRLDDLHARRDALGLDGESSRMLKRLHLEFVRAGAQLDATDQRRLAHIMERLAHLTTRFGQNVMADENGWHLVLRDASDFDGLPSSLRDATAQAAAERGLAGHIVPLMRSMVIPFLSFSKRRDLREAVWRAYTSRGAHDGERDNRPVIREILQLRAQQARLLGYATFADYSLADKMAREPAAVMRLLDDVWHRAKLACERERAQLQTLMAEQGVTQAIEAWDWPYWAEQVRQLRYAIDDAEVKPYFTLERMTQAAFDCALRLFGLRFERRQDLLAYHPDVVVYEVRDAATSRTLGLFLHDNYARPGKRSGAWMSALRWQSRTRGHMPVILNNNNFNKPTAGEPALLSFDDVRTLFHEFGHALHGLLSNVTFDRLSGTQVLRDFVELPSQLFENWALEPQVMRRHALHVSTGQPIPDGLIERLRQSRRFGQGYETVRYTASSLTDMAVHALPEEQLPDDVVAFEEAVLAERGLPHGVGVNHRFTHFQHLFRSDGYAAGYYVYLWAEVLDADAFDAFVEARDAFDPATAARLKRHVYSAGNSVDPAATYRAFRGRDARLEPMLAQRGILAEAERR